MKGEETLNLLANYAAQKPQAGHLQDSISVLLYSLCFLSMSHRIYDYLYKSRVTSTEERCTTVWWVGFFPEGRKLSLKYLLQIREHGDFKTSLRVSFQTSAIVYMHKDESYSCCLLCIAFLSVETLRTSPNQNDI